jgi:hypothetical protein
MYPCTDSIRSIALLAGDLLSIIIALPVWLTYACGSAAKRDTKRNAAGQSLPGDEQKEDLFVTVIVSFYRAGTIGMCRAASAPK